MRMLLLACVGLVLLGCADSSQPAAKVDTQTLDGKWRIVTLIDNGQVVPPATVKQTFSGDGTVTVSNGTIQVEAAGGRPARQLKFKMHEAGAARTIELTTSDGKLCQGIYRRDRDVLTLCLGDKDSNVRPSDFGSEEGSNTMLVILQAVSEPAKPVTPPVVAPSIDGDNQKRLVGAWGYQDNDAIIRMSLNADNSFSISKESKKVFKKIFDPEERTSGTWSTKEGTIILKVTAADEKSLRGHTLTYQINSLRDQDMVVLDEKGSPIRLWRLR
jgi:uncharacterized protein (TIGR03067 family)